MVFYLCVCLCVHILQQIRVVVRELEQKVREIYTAMQAVHQCPEGQGENGMLIFENEF